MPLEKGSGQKVPNCACGKPGYRIKHNQPVCLRCDTWEDEGRNDPPFFCGIPDSVVEEQLNEERRELNRWLNGLTGPAPRRGRPPKKRHGLIVGKGKAFA